MAALGIVIRFPKKGRPEAMCVVVGGDEDGHVEHAESFTLPSEDIGLASQLQALAQGLRSRVESLGIDAVWVRVADMAPLGRKPGPRIRLQAEGAVMAAARDRVVNVHVGDGKTIGQLIGGSKADADAEGASLVGPNASKEEAEAAAAALAAVAASPLSGV